ncbi:LysR family transcriptional regulator [Pusillimonas caeni]|uniref:LysR family transcriptional regulator n=1 Tax=Pusillimonas caeni TaxID=1348472 RepID=UPI0014307011|nr:LysR family transcriptional regulator [Pusillimonas caeni]
MNLELVQCFLRVAEFGSINRAAEDLEMTQPALARRIAALEHDLSVTLLVRGSRGVRLTDAGLILANGARPILRQAELLRAEIGRQVKTQVSIGLPFSMNKLVTAPFASRELDRESPVSLRIYEGFLHHLREWMHQSLIDVAIMEDREDESPQFERIPLVREQVFLVGNADSGLRPDRGVDARQLGRCRLILPGRPNIIRMRVEAYLKQHGEKYRRAADAETLPLCLSLVNDGHGMTVMPYCALYEFPMSTLRAAPIVDLPMTWSMYVNNVRRHSAGVRHIAEGLRNAMVARIRSGEWQMAEALLEAKS